jgi:hypothetical protein
VQEMSPNAAGSAIAGAAAINPAGTAIAAATRTFVIIEVLPDAADPMLPAATAAAPRKSAHARPDEVPGVIGVEVAAVHHLLGHVLLGSSVGKFCADLVSGDDGRLR